MYSVYAIKSTAHNYIYVGFTNNLTRRLSEHNNSEQTESREEARKKEKYYKSGIGKEFLKSLLK